LGYRSVTLYAARWILPKSRLFFCNKSQVAQDKVLHLRYFRDFSGDDDFAAARKADGIIKGINRTRTHSLRLIDNGMHAMTEIIFPRVRAKRDLSVWLCPEISDSFHVRKPYGVIFKKFVRSSNMRKLSIWTHPCWYWWH